MEAESVTKSPEAQLEAKRLKLRSMKRSQVVFGLLMIMLNGGLLLSRSQRDGFDRSMLLLIAVLAGSLVIFIPWVNRPGRVLKRMAALADLDAGIANSADPNLRDYLIWIEYGMAWSTVHTGQPADRPEDYLLESVAAQKRIGYVPGWMVTGLSVFFVGAIVVGLVAAVLGNEQLAPPGAVWVLVALVAVVAASITGSCLVKNRLYRERRLLGRGVRATMGLPPQERWDFLLEIARQDLAAYPVATDPN